METAHRFLVIRPGEKTTEVLTDVLGPSLSTRIIGTDGVDHGGLVPRDAGRGLSVIVAEFGLYDGLGGKYCAIGRSLRSGNIIVYAHLWGETVDISDAEIAMVRSTITWFDNALQAAQLMIDGVIDRPQVAINGEVVWQWPSSERPAW